MYLLIWFYLFIHFFFSESNLRVDEIQVLIEIVWEDSGIRIKSQHASVIK